LSASPDLIPLGGKPPLRLYLRQLWSRREFAVAIAAGEVRSQNMDTVLGNLWHVLNPLLLTGVYYLIFGAILRTDRGVENFIAFLTIGVFAYHYSQKSIVAGAKAVVANEGLIRSIQFPRAVLPTATVIGHTLSFLPAVAIMLVVALLSGVDLHVAWLLLVPILVLQALFNMGAAFVLARLTDRFHDVTNVLPYLFRIAFYMSGILYSVDRFVQDETLRRLFDLNPFYVFVTLARAPILDNAIPPVTMLSALLWTAGLLLFGFHYFRSGETEYGRG
jgi:teichoic acid transport system permease protein